MARSLWRAAAVLGLSVSLLKTLGCDTSEPATNRAFSDADGDGLSDIDERVLYGTSPVLADTDGDGMSDYEEIVLRSFDPNVAPLRFNPRVADLPLLEVKVLPPPLLTLRVVSTNGETMTFETIQEFEQSEAWTAGTTTEESFTDAIGSSRTRSEGVAIEFQDGTLRMGQAPTRAEPYVLTVTNERSSTIDRTTASGVTLAFSAAATRQIRQATAVAQAYAASHDVAVSGGLLEVLVELINRGRRTLQVKNMVLSAVFIGSDGTRVPVTNLEVSSEITNFAPYSIAPGSRQGPVNVARDTLTLEQVAMLTDALEAIEITVGIFELADADGRPYAFDLPAIDSRTAAVEIDYGDEKPRERHLVATNLDPERAGVSVRRVFEEILHMPFEIDADKRLLSVRGVTSPQGDAPGWSLLASHLQRGELVDRTYEPPLDLEAIVLRAGDTLVVRRSPP